MKSCKLMVWVGFLLLSFSCQKESGPDSIDDEQPINTLEISIAPKSIPDYLPSTYFDPDGPGGQQPESEPILIEADILYSVRILFIHTAADGEAIRLNDKILKGSDNYLVCFDYSPPLQLQQQIEDFDFNGNPLGMVGTLQVARPAVNQTYQMTITLIRNLEKNVTDLVDWCTSGEIEFQATFDLTVE